VKKTTFSLAMLAIAFDDNVADGCKQTESIILLFSTEGEMLVLHFCVLCCYVLIRLRD